MIISLILGIITGAFIPRIEAALGPRITGLLPFKLDQLGQRVLILLVSLLGAAFIAEILSDAKGIWLAIGLALGYFWKEIRALLNKK